MQDVQSNALKYEYIHRINKVLDYIDLNITGDLSLETLSNVANFSSYHFHRIFSAMMREPLSKYIKRIRLEKAALILVSNSNYPVGEIASMCGFDNHSSFSRAFQIHFGFSASELRKDKSLIENKKNISESNKGKMDYKKRETDSKKCKTDSKKGKDDLKSAAYNGVVAKMASENYNPLVKPFGIEVIVISDMIVAYIRVIGGEKEVFQKAIARLMRWSEIRDLIHFPETKILSLYHDNPDITDGIKLRTSLCISVPEHTKVNGEIGKMVIPGGKYAVAHFIIGADEFKPAWDFIWGEWLPESGYQPDERPCFEVYMNNPDEHPEHKTIVDIYVPVKPL